MTDNMIKDTDIDVTAQDADLAADLADDQVLLQADTTDAPADGAATDAADAEPEVIESMDDYLDEIEQSLKRLREGDTVTGTVSGVYEDHITLDLPYFAPGIIYIEELSFDPEFSIMDDIHNGDTITAMVIDANDGSGNVVLSRLEAAENSAWDELKKAHEDQSIHTVKVAEAVKSGVTAYLCGIRGFIPASKLDLAYVEEADLASYVGKNIQVQVITADEDDKRLVLSAKEVLKKRA
ncbi:MAG: S1 RNA-binding domain-containing protein, partial [Lachnospiraceae bacterium]